MNGVRIGLGRLCEKIAVVTSANAPRQAFHLIARMREADRGVLRRDRIDLDAVGLDAARLSATTSSEQTANDIEPAPWFYRPC